MKRGKALRDSKGQPTAPNAIEIPVVMFVLAEKSPGAFILRIVTNEDVLNDIKKQCALDTFLRDVDQLYADFRGRFDEKRPKRIN